MITGLEKQRKRSQNLYEEMKNKQWLCACKRDLNKEKKKSANLFVNSKKVFLKIKKDIAKYKRNCYLTHKV